MPEQSKREYRQQRVIPKTVVGKGQHERVQADFNHIQSLRAAEHMCVQVADTRLYELHVTPFNFDVINGVNLII